MVPRHSSTNHHEGSVERHVLAEPKLTAIWHMYISCQFNKAHFNYRGKVNTVMIWLSKAILNLESHK